MRKTIARFGCAHVPNVEKACKTSALDRTIIGARNGASRKSSPLTRIIISRHKKNSNTMLDEIASELCSNLRDSANFPMLNP
jgi:hypothetical protein